MKKNIKNKIECPLCGQNMNYTTDKLETHVWICLECPLECPAVLFEHCMDSDNV